MTDPRSVGGRDGSAPPVPDVPEPGAAAGSRPAGRGLWRPLRRRGDLLVALLTALLGFGLVVSVRETRTTGLTTARPEDLVRILDELDVKEQKLRQEVLDLQVTRDQLAGGGQSQAALDEATRRAGDLGILAGTVAATGRGIVMRITDPRGQVSADVLVDAVQELRDAGAEAMDLDGVRLGASSYIVDRPGGVTVDAHEIAAPYVLTVIGDPPTLSTALNIPGGVVNVVQGRQGAGITVDERDRVDITSLRSTPAPRFARPATPSPSPGGS